MKSLLRLRPYFKRYKNAVLQGVVYIMLSTVFAVIAPVLIRRVIDDLEHDISSGALLQYALLILAVSAVSGVFMYLTRQTLIVTSRYIEYDLRNDFLKHLQLLSQRYFMTTSTGDLMAYSTNDIAAVRMFVGPAVMYTSNTVFSFIIIVGMMLSIHPLLTLYALLPLPLLSFAVNRLGKLIHKRFEEIQGQYAILTSRTQESISGIRVVKAYLREAHETSVFRMLSEDYRMKNMPMLALLVGVSVILIIWLGGREVILGSISLGELTQFLIYLGMLIWPMAAIGWVVNLIQRAAASMKRLENVFSSVPDISDGPDTDYSIQEIKGDIRFEQVSFRYAESSPTILNDISLHIPTGETLGIIGMTGAGKSTLINLIPRLYDATAGVVRVDGHDITRIPLDTLRGGIACVPQETFLFSDSIRNNIAYGVDDASEDEIRWAAQIAQIDKDIVDFPRGYDTVLGERGITLSGGQKQRVSLARAILRKPSILILDDALSAVDTHTEEDILAGLREVMLERTSLLISHRISTVRHANHIIVMRDGSIIESGTHEQLLHLDGMYADLHRKQLLAEELEEIE